MHSAAYNKLSSAQINVTESALRIVTDYNLIASTTHHIPVSCAVYSFNSIIGLVNFTLAVSNSSQA